MGRFVSFVIEEVEIVGVFGEGNVGFVNDCSLLERCIFFCC